MNQTWLKSRRADVEEWLDTRGSAHTLSAGRYLLHAHVRAALESYVRGDILEAGAGGSPFSAQLEAIGDRLVTLDVNDRYGHIDVLADVQAMPQVGSSSFDTVVCTQVLEHLPDPLAALTEIRRVLKDGGVLVLSAPHLSMVHEAPNDFFRYTRFGLHRLAEAAGFEVKSITSTGGLLAFLLHPLSVGTLTIASVLPPLRRLVWAVNYLTLVRGGALLDRLVGAPSLFPLDHVMIATAESRSTPTQRDT